MSGRSGEGSARRATLVEAAYHAIAQRGFENLRLREIATSAGIDHSTLHHYFATKQDLIDAVVVRATMPLYNTIIDAAGDDRLAAHLRILVDQIHADPDLFTVLAEIDLRARRDQNVRTMIERVEEGWRLGLSELLDHDETNVELVIAAVKGIRLNPAAAPEVLARLGQLITNEWTNQ